MTTVILSVDKMIFLRNYQIMKDNDLRLCVDFSSYQKSCNSILTELSSQNNQQTLINILTKQEHKYSKESNELHLAFRDKYENDLE